MKIESGDLTMRILKGVLADHFNEKGMNGDSVSEAMISLIKAFSVLNSFSANMQQKSLVEYKVCVDEMFDMAKKAVTADYERILIKMMAEGLDERA